MVLVRAEPLGLVLDASHEGAGSAAEENLSAGTNGGRRRYAFEVAGMATETVGAMTTQRHWAAETAGAIISADAARREAHATFAQRSATVRALVDTNGAAWIGQLKEELQAAAEAVNARTGRRIINCVHGDGELFTLLAVELTSAYVLVVPELMLSQPGVTITTQMPGGPRFQVPYDFVAEGNRLRLLIAGLDCEPAAAARTIAEPWIRPVIAAHQR